MTNEFDDPECSKFWLSDQQFSPSFEMTLLSDKSIFHTLHNNDPELNVFKTTNNSKDNNEERIIDIDKLSQFFIP